MPLPFYFVIQDWLVERQWYEPIIILSFILLNFSSSSQDYFLSMDAGSRSRNCVFVLISVANIYHFHENWVPSVCHA
jgi:hypothetical protein